MIILADNQAITRAGLRFLLHEVSQTEIMEVSTKRELIDRLFDYPSAAVVLDYTLFDFSSIDDLLNLNYRFSKVGWLLFSEELSLSFLNRLVVNEENFGVLLKEGSREEIVDALNHVVAGEKYVMPRLAQLLRNARNKLPEEHFELTQSEKDILRLIALGRSNKEIAAERFSSVHTIATHRKNIFRKLDLNTAQEATKYALRAGLIDLAEYVI